MVNSFYIILAPGKLLLIFFSLLCREGSPVPLGYKKMPSREARLALEPFIQIFTNIIMPRNFEKSVSILSDEL